MRGRIGVSDETLALIGPLLPPEYGRWNGAFWRYRPWAATCVFDAMLDTFPIARDHRCDGCGRPAGYRTVRTRAADDPCPQFRCRADRGEQHAFRAVGLADRRRGGILRPILRAQPCGHRQLEQVNQWCLVIGPVRRYRSVGQSPPERLLCRRLLRPAHGIVRGQKFARQRRRRITRRLIDRLPRGDGELPFYGGR